MTRLLSIILTVFTVINAAMAQETEYKKANVEIAIAPFYPEFINSYRTFDLTFTDERQTLAGEKQAVTLTPIFSPFQKVAESKDLHVIASLYDLRISKGEQGNVYQINMYVSVCNKYGTKLYEQHYFYGGIPVPANNNSKISLVENSLSASLRKFSNGILGYKAAATLPLAYVDGVNKKSELAAWKEQIGALVKDFEQNGASSFLLSAKKYLESWEKMTTYSEGKDANEVRRAAYQNLAVYYVLQKDFAKFEAIIEEYKKIDKEVKAFMGLARYKNSEDLEKFRQDYYREMKKIEEKAGGTTELTKAEIIDRMNFITIDGTVEIKERKKNTTYTGLIKVRNISETPQPTGNMMSLDLQDIEMLVIAPNASTGKTDTMRSSISKIVSMTDKAGKKYVAQKVTSPGSLVPNAYALSVSSFVSPKVNVYRCIVPAESVDDYVVIKADDKSGGIKSSLLLGFKRITTYLNDCPDFNNQVKAGTIHKDMSIEDIVKAYAECK